MIPTLIAQPFSDPDWLFEPKLDGYRTIALVREALIVCGYTEGTGARAETFGALVLGMRQMDGSLAYAGEVRTGFDLRSLRTIRRRLDVLRSDVSPFGESVFKRGSRWSWLPQSGPITWVRPELVAEVKYAERTDDGQLRAPVFLRLLENQFGQPNAKPPSLE
jgi:bifunctional non-homologous end joining protein LigD